MHQPLEESLCSVRRLLAAAVVVALSLLGAFAALGDSGSLERLGVVDWSSKEELQSTWAAAQAEAAAETTEATEATEAAEATTAEAATAEATTESARGGKDWEAAAGQLATAGGGEEEIPQTTESWGTTEAALVDSQEHGIEGESLWTGVGGGGEQQRPARHDQSAHPAVPLLSAELPARRPARQGAPRAGAPSGRAPPGRAPPSPVEETGTYGTRRVTLKGEPKSGTTWANVVLFVTVHQLCVVQRRCEVVGASVRQHGVRTPQTTHTSLCCLTASVLPPAAVRLWRPALTNRWWEAENNRAADVAGCARWRRASEQASQQTRGAAASRAVSRGVALT